MRIGLYARVSTAKKAITGENGRVVRAPQTVDNQLLPLRDYCKARGLEIVEEFTDVGVSGTKDKRPGLDRLMAAARARKVDAVIVARFDRFARSTRHLVTALEEFNALGVHFISLAESIDTSTPMGRMVFTVISAVSELEGNLIKERIHMGLDRARRQKKTLGRPERIVSKDKIFRMREAGATYADIATALHCSVGKIYNIINAAQSAA
jgi:DNA invertase Pin-like site-specific DNA recombinase